MTTDDPEPRFLCDLCERPVWDQAQPVELDDSVSVLNLRVHRGCARRALRERERAASPAR